MRARLLAAAREVFERDGFLDARVTDISAAAGVAHGSFYTYFRSKTEVFRVLVAGTMDELYASLGAGGYAASPTGSPTAGRRRRRRPDRPGQPPLRRRLPAEHRPDGAVRAGHHLRSEVRALRQAAREDGRPGAAHSRSCRRDGFDVDLDAESAPHALVAMVNGLLHYWLVLGAGSTRNAWSRR